MWVTPSLRAAPRALRSASSRPRASSRSCAVSAVLRDRVTTPAALSRLRTVWMFRTDSAISVSSRHSSSLSEATRCRWGPQPFLAPVLGEPHLSHRPCGQRDEGAFDERPYFPRPRRPRRGSLQQVSHDGQRTVEALALTLRNERRTSMVRIPAVLAGVKEPSWMRVRSFQSNSYIQL